MKLKLILRNAALLLALIFLVFPLQAVNIENGVSRQLALYRADNLRNISYSLSFSVPDDMAKPVEFFETLRFSWLGHEDLQIDFQGDAEQLDGVIMVNGKAVNTVVSNEHIIIPNRYLNIGENKVLIGGVCGDKALNRHEDFLYTLFVPDHARSVFPCFDQPDLKAQFSVDLDLPEGWVSMSNDTERPIPTYLFSFTAGKFQVQPAMRDGRELTALYRETDPDKVAQLPEIFDQVALSLQWMERYTGLNYPFEKYGFVILPGYQFGGMEHPGCIQYTDERMFLGPNPSADERMSRLNLIAHETAHMWFGDLVTMKWFDDVWTKEVFANFMADKISREKFPGVNHDLAFIKTHYPVAMSTDRTEGTHPIQQPLDNLNQAGLLYGNIIYHKAPIMMRKLEQEKGAEALRLGLRSYLRKYAYDNATWDDLIVELDKFEPEHSARSFSDVWVKQKGMPVIKCDEGEEGYLEIIQQDPLKRGLVWKQGFDVAVISSSGIDVNESVYMDRDRIVIPIPAGSTPMLNSDGEGYGRFVVDGKSLLLMADAWQTMPNDINRYAAVLNLYENYHLGNLQAGQLFDILFKILSHEQNELIASTTCSFLGTVLSRLDGSLRLAAESRMFDLAQSHSLQSVRQSLLRQLSVKATSPDVVDEIYSIWKNQTSSFLNSRDYMRMAYHLAIMCPGQWEGILATQRDRLKTDDERSEFDFISRACNPDEQVQQQLFDDLLKIENRRVEPWSRSLLALLNDPTREPHSNRYLEPGLDALEEIQRTGDIFFPGYWLFNLLDGHQSTEARQIVNSWINTHPTLSPALMNKLKENAYWLITK